ncbi:MAG: FMN-binding protein [Planctomycetota bacterium]|jgi:Na+-transporting NADH:ubiquinone oxidoreductase subunit C
MRDRLYTLAFVVAVSAALTAAVSAVRLASYERAQMNQQIAEKRVILRALGIGVPADADLREVSNTYATRVKGAGIYFEGEGGRAEVLAGYSESGNLVGYVFPVSGRGFWDTIKGYMALSPDQAAVLGLAFYQQNETPGLGAEITRPWFEEQFRDLELPLVQPADGLYVRLLPPGSELGPRDVHAVTGATGTSQAVQRIVNRDLAALLEALGRESADP